MPYYVYFILCKGGSFYTGYTKNIDMRVKLHESGKGARFTRTHKPEKVAFVEIFESRVKAMRREKEIKKLTHQQKLSLVNSQSVQKSDGEPQ